MNNKGLLLGLLGMAAMGGVEHYSGGGFGTKNPKGFKSGHFYKHDGKKKQDRNAPCSCGSGLKAKKCCK